MFSSKTYIGLFRELSQLHSDPGPLDKPWLNVPMTKYHVLNELEISDVYLKLKGSGAFYQPGFSTDVSESCAWITPFIKPPGNLQDLR